MRTTMSSVTVMVHEAIGLRWPSTSTRHCRQAPTGSSSGWSQNRGIWMPISSAARITSVPLGTLSWWSSMVRRRPSSVVGSRPAAGRRSRGPSPSSRQLLHRAGPTQHRGVRVERAAAVARCAHVLVAEVLDGRDDRAGRAVAERAERLADDGVGDVEQLVQIVLACRARSPAARRSAPASRCPRGTACTCRRIRVRRTAVQRRTARTTQVVSSKICSALVPSIEPAAATPS